MRASVDRACAWAAALGGGLLAAAGRHAMPPFLPIGDQPPYDGAIERARMLVEPIAHAPWLGAWPRPLALTGIAVALIGLWQASRRLGASAPAALMVVLAFAARPDLGGPLALGSWPFIGAALVWSALAPTSAAPPAGWARAVAAGAAVACWPPWLVATPLLLARGGWGRRAGVIAAVAGGAVLGLWWWAMRASGLSGVAVGLGDVWAVVRDASWRGSLPFAWPPLSSSLLPVALMAVGAVIAWKDSLTRARWIAAAAVVLALAWAMPGWTAETARALYWLAWPLAGLGVTWFGAQASSGGRPWALGAMAVVLVGGGLASHVRDVDLVEPRAFAAAFSEALDAKAGGAFTAIVEDSRVDTALVAFTAGERLDRRVPVDPALLERARDEHRTVIVFPTGRALAELWGYELERLAVIEAPVRYQVSRLVTRRPCLEVGDGWKAIPVGPGRLGLHLPPGSGRMELDATGRGAATLEATTILRRRVGNSTAIEPAGVRLTVDALATIPADYQIHVGGDGVDVRARAVGVAGAAWICAAGTAAQP